MLISVSVMFGIDFESFVKFIDYHENENFEFPALLFCYYSLLKKTVQSISMKSIPIPIKNIRIPFVYECISINRVCGIYDS